MRRTVAAMARGVALAVGAYIGFLMTALFLHRSHVRRHHIESAWFWLAALLLLYAALAVQPEGHAEPRTTTTRDRTWVMVAALVSAWIVYARSIGLGLLSDDFVLLQKAQSANFWRLGNEFFRPLPLMLWYVLHGVSAGPWLLHVINVTLHGVAAGVTGMLALKLGWGRFWSLFATVWMVVQPSAVETVAWASGVQDLLMTVSVLGAVLLAASSVGFRSVLVVALLIAALLSKETAVAAPALIAVFWMAGSRRAAQQHWRDVLLAAATVAAYVTLRVFVAAPPDDYTRAPSGYFVKELIVRPFASLAVPWHDHAIADQPALGIGWALFPLVLLLATVVRNRPGSLFRALQFAVWVLIAISPVYAYFFISPHLEGSRYLYLAAPAWVLLLTGLLRSAFGARPSWLAAAVAAMVVLLSAFGVMLNLRPWIAAAELRDVVLREARLARNGADCRAFTFEGVPDSLDGAYVFRNGFDAAVGESATSPSGMDCRFRWDGSRFVRN